MILELLLFHKIGKLSDSFSMTVMLIFLDRFGFGSRDQQVNIGHRSAIFSMRHALLSMVSMLCELYRGDAVYLFCHDEDQVIVHSSKKNIYGVHDHLVPTTFFRVHDHLVFP